jgi:hypothetical protein
MSQNAVANVPTMLPIVETEKRRPAVRPRRASSRACSRTAIGVTEASTTLGAPKRSTDASSGFARGPGSHPTTASSTARSMNGIASTPAAPSAIAATSSS